MNIGIDVDGTLTRYPEFFVELGRSWRAAGGKVFIITGLSNEGLDRRRIDYPVLNDTSFYDKLITSGEYNNFERSLVGKVENEIIVGIFKQRVCKELGVAVMFDDKALIHRACGDVPIFQVAKS